VNGYGHASTEMTMRIYTQMLPGDDVRAVGLLDDGQRGDLQQTFNAKGGFLSMVG